MMLRLYLAGGLFTVGERMWNAFLAKSLRKAGHEVWLPQEHDCTDLGSAFRDSIKGIHWCEIVIACMDGSDPDSGTCGECGYAYTKRPIMTYRTDFRSGGEIGGPGYNLMLSHFASICLRLDQEIGLLSPEEVVGDIVKALEDETVLRTLGVLS